VCSGNDIDTDRIIPGRFLRTLTFAGLGEHAFADDRRLAKGDHPFDVARFRGASILFVGMNFGCGSSREHAARALRARGLRAVVGSSFGEIFRGNCAALGLPCVTLAPGDLEAAMDDVELAPRQEVVIDLEARTVRCRRGAFPLDMPESIRHPLLEGTWDTTSVLLQAGDAIERCAQKLPYLTGFPGGAQK